MRPTIEQIKAAITPLERFFGDRIFIINRDSRGDRLLHAQGELVSLGVSFSRVRRFKAHEPDSLPTYEGQPDGNAGCVSSHRDLVAACGVNDWPNMLVLEDDFCLVPGVDHQAVFAAALETLDPQWDMFYLGGSYANDPQYLHSKQWVRIQGMVTTSSYAITGRFARKLSPYLYGHGPIDTLMQGRTPQARAYCIRPRLFGQYTSRSDLTGRETDYMPSMTDSRHEEMLLEGAWHEEGASIDSLVNRREIAAPNDLDGQRVNFEGKWYVIERIELPAHPAPWRRGELIRYYVRPE